MLVKGTYLDRPTDLPGRIFKVLIPSNLIQFSDYLCRLDNIQYRSSFFYVSQHSCGILQNLSGTQVLVEVCMTEGKNGSPVGVEVPELLDESQ